MMIGLQIFPLLLIFCEALLALVVSVDELMELGLELLNFPGEQVNLGGELRNLRVKLLEFDDRFEAWMQCNSLVVAPGF